MITLFDRYILAEILRPLVAALLIALMVFLVSRFVELIDLVVGAEGPLRVLFEILGYLIPRYLSMALPLSLLLGVMIAFARMSRDGEIDAMQTTGFGLARQLRPALAVAVGAVVISVLLFGYLSPYARYAYQSVLYAVSNAAFHASVRAGVFARVGDVTFLVQGIGADGVSFERVFLYEVHDDGQTSAIMARDGNLVRPAMTAAPVLRLFDGVRLLTHDAPEGTLDPAGHEASLLRFTELRTVLRQDHADMFRPRGRHEQELTLGELWRLRHDPPSNLRVSDLVAELHGRIVRVVSIPFIPVIGIALAIRRKRTDQFAAFAVGLLILIGYEQVVEFGKNAVESGEVGPFVGVWLSFFAFAGVTIAVFVQKALLVPAQRTLSIGRFVDGLGGYLRRRNGGDHHSSSSGMTR